MLQSEDLVCMLIRRNQDGVTLAHRITVYHISVSAEGYENYKYCNKV